MRFGSICSGIEAASVAWGPLGWEAAWFAEVEPFPCAVLAHHYPYTLNVGDMTALPALIRSGAVEAPELLCGGTPCQAFSVAGKRRSLDDARGNLTLTFCDIADAIDEVRNDGSVIFWENVPGVLNTKDNAFGCFLGALAGEGGPLEPAGRKWSNAGVVLGPKRTIAWRVLDAQYFGVAQRRRRVFVVASSRNGFDPAAVLFEFDGVRRDTAPSREAGEGAAAGFARSVGGGGLGTDFDCDGGVITMARGQGGAEIGFDRGPTLTRNHEVPIAAYAIQAGALRTNPASGPNGVGVKEGVAYTIEARSEVQAVAFLPGNLTRGAGASPSGDVFPTLKADHGRTFSDQSPHVAALGLVDTTGHQGDRFVGPGDVTQALSANAGNNGGGGGTCLLTPVAQVRRLTPRECERLQGFPDDWTLIPWRKKPASECPDGPRYKALGNSWAVPVVRWIGRRIDAIASK